jgi:hypothetical protein
MATMKGLSRIVAAVAVLTLSVSAVASAQHGSGDPGVASFLSAVSTIRDEMTALNAEKRLSLNDFHLANLQKFTNPGNAAVVAKAIQKNSHDIHELREALGRNAIVVRVLANANVSIEQVVALDIQHGGESTIYYQPPG